MSHCAADGTQRTSPHVRDLITDQPTTDHSRAGHTVCKKLMLEINWQTARYLCTKGVIHETRASILYIPSLMYLTTFGRMMQSSSDNALLTIVLELGSIVAEVFEARDLLRLDTPYMSTTKNASWFMEGARSSSRLFASSRQVVAGAGVSGQNDDEGAVEDEETDGILTLRQRFCSDVLIATQMAEVCSPAL